MATLMRALALTGGEWVIYILLFFSVLAMAIILERWIVLMREKKFAAAARQIFLELVEDQSDIRWPQIVQTLESNRGFLALTLSDALRHAHHGPESAEEHLESAMLSRRQKLEKRLIILGTLGNNAVYVGLFGTVLGVIKAFRDLAASQGGPEVVMQGLSQALIATAVGLMVALPCTAAYNFFQKQIKDLCVESESLGRIFLARIKRKESR